MAKKACVTFAALLATSSAAEVNPVEKVIKLIEGLKKEVEDEGAAEAKSYDQFSCFCKDKTSDKSKSIKKGNDNINMLSADIAEKTQEKADDIAEVADRKRNQEKMSKELDDTHARCAKEKAQYDAEAADLSKAISSLQKAIKAMKSTGGSASLLEVQSVATSLSTSVAFAKAASAKKLVDLLKQKVDPNDPEYGYHSQDIISICVDLLASFKNDKSDLDTEWGKTDKGCTETKNSLKKEMQSNKNAMNSLNESIEKLAKEIAAHREDLVEAQGDLKDDEQYLNDLTRRCEDRANDYDQRSAMRGDELGALKNALQILTKSVKGADSEANERALLLQKTKASSGETKNTASAALSFIQGALVKEHRAQFLAKNTVDISVEQEGKKHSALVFLRKEGQRIGSVAIEALAARSAADPFKKVKGLIQKLVERLLKESAAEATKKGFCDEAVGSAEHERDTRFQQANDLSRELKALEAKDDELSDEIEVLTKDIKTESADLKEASEDREKEKSDNMNTLKVAKEGLDAVNEAILTLKSFYSSAAKASLVQASPVDEDTQGPGFSGSYNGKQGGMKAVFALLDVIQSDFDRTLRKTEEEEDKAHREHVKFVQTSKSSIAGKSTKQDLDEQDLKSTRTSIKQKFADMQDTVELLDKALQELEELKPTCIDTGMSYKERVAKREQEIKALENALKILAP